MGNTSEALAAFHGALEDIERLGRPPSMVEDTLFRVAYRFIDTKPEIALHVLSAPPLTGRLPMCNINVRSIAEWRLLLRQFAH